MKCRLGELLSQTRWALERGFGGKAICNERSDYSLWVSGDTGALVGGVCRRIKVLLDLLGDCEGEKSLTHGFPSWEHCLLFKQKIKG